MKILVFGKSGQVARALQRYDFVTTLDRAQADLEKPDFCAEIIAKSTADVIINAAAYTDVDGAESDQETAYSVNAAAPALMARAAARRGMPFLHISTDYVFNGSGSRPWLENDQPSPLSVYGKSKLKGEQGVADAGGAYAILRTSWVFSRHGANFVKTMLRLAESRDELRIVNDQIGGPTAAQDIAAALVRMAQAFNAGAAESGIYHFAGTPETSWAHFAKEIFRQSGAAVKISGIPSSEYPTAAQRPLNSRLNCDAINRVFGITQPVWQESLNTVLQELRS